MDAFAEVGNLLQQVVKQPYREEPMTDEEWSTWVDRIMLLAESEKRKLNAVRRPI